jgi:hypothetical protein
MNKPKLALVAKPAIRLPFDDETGLKRIETLRTQLLAAVVRYVREGKVGKPVDRLLISSDKAGIPRGLIELELRK